MPVKTPFFSRTSQLCDSLQWKEWAGYYAVSSYGIPHDAEYFAFRNAAGLLDITPLFKYSVTGPDAARFLSRIMVRDIEKLKQGRVTYCCWCTEEGKVVDDGTVMRRAEDDFFVTSADPCYSWFSRFLRGYDVELHDISEQVAGLALQGPTSRDTREAPPNYPPAAIRPGPDGPEGALHRSINICAEVPDILAKGAPTVRRMR